MGILNSFSLEGKVAWITGASYGIGFAIATAYAEAGATIVFNDINQELVDKGLASYQEKGIEAKGYVCDVTDEDAVKAAVETLRHLCAEWDAKEEYPVSIAVGYAMQAGRTMTADELFMEADAAMYQNKSEIKKAVGGISR